ncbi:MAG: hypothetical protein MRY83_24750, partial [Flavobacteriales bacterium]|nr:hypothetical protein [Flavobacteriales bacterium]
VALPQLIRSNEILLDLDWSLRVSIYKFMFAFFSYGLSLTYFALMSASMGILYYSAVETSSAKDLRERIKNIGFRKRSIINY